MPNITNDIPRPAALKVGMIGGGEGAYFASLHRAAMRLCNRYRLVAGVFSSQPEKSLVAGQALGVDAQRVYTSVEAMARAEAGRLDAVVVVTPNHLHFEACEAFLEAGIAVICDKPLVNQLEQAQRLAELAARRNTFFALTYTYQGYPMVREARRRILDGSIGQVRFIQVEYLLEWLAPGVETLNPSLAWRGDPAKAGASSVVGDIGTHAFNLMEFLTGQRARALSATLGNKVPGWQMDDHCVAQLAFADGLDGLMWLSFAAPGHRNGLKFKVVGSRASLEWSQELPELLHLKPLDGAESILRRGQADNPEALACSSLPAGCSEGYLEALAILYQDFAVAISSGEDWNSATPVPLPDLQQGIRGVELAHLCVASSAQRQWLEFAP